MESKSVNNFTTYHDEVVRIFACLSFKVTGYSCAPRAKCIGKCILELTNQESLARRA